MPACVVCGDGPENLTKVEDYHLCERHFAISPKAIPAFRENISKQELLLILYQLLNADGGDILGQRSYFTVVGAVRQQLRIEEKAGTVRLTRLNNGFIKSGEVIS